MNLRHITFACLAFPFCCWGQWGTVDFSNHGFPLSASPLVTNGLTMQPVPAGSPGAFVVGLYFGSLGTPENSLTLAATTSSWPFDGIFNGGVVTLPVQGGTQVALQIRGWQAGFPTYEAAAADPSLPLVGRGNLQSITTGGGGIEPAPPASLLFPMGAGDIPLRPITLYPAPEPSASVLLLVGAGLFAAARATRRHPK